MERVLGHVDVEEMYMDVDPENLPDKGEIVETAHFFVGQAYNAHIHVVEKESGDMVMHINCTIMYSKERLQAFADLIETRREVFLASDLRHRLHRRTS